MCSCRVLARETGVTVSPFYIPQHTPSIRVAHAYLCTLRAYAAAARACIILLGGASDACHSSQSLRGRIAGSALP